MLACNQNLIRSLLQQSIQQGANPGENALNPVRRSTEAYVPDLNVRMALYRRLAGIETREDIERFAAELIDRFGPLPEEVRHLFEIVAIKQLCRAASVEKVEAGPKGDLSPSATTNSPILWRL